MTNGMNVANKTVLITGANRGIGRALADEALKRGARRVYAATRVPMQIADERVTPFTLDVTSSSQIQPLPLPSPRTGVMARSRQWTASSQPSCRKISQLWHDVADSSVAHRA